MAGWFSNINLENIGAQVSGFTQSLGESAAKIGEDLQEKVNTLAAFDLEDIGKVIKDAEEDIVSEETKIKQEEAGLKLTEVKILPWETRLEQKTILSHDLMERVLSLSLEESNFTTSPPGAGIAPGANEEALPGEEDRGNVRHNTGASPATEFELGRHINVSVKMLALDTNLAKVHARLISRIPEPTFWHRYFSRVEALRAEMGFEPLCEGLREETSGTSTSEEYDKVSHGDVQSMNSHSERALDVGDDGKSGDNDNNDGDDDDDDDYSDLGDLGDLDGASDGSIDAALEAEIAAELGEG